MLNSGEPILVVGAISVSFSVLQWPIVRMEGNALSELIHGEITGKVLGAAFEVWKVLGYGFLEKVYENALIEEMRTSGLTVRLQADIEVVYKGLWWGTMLRTC
jgi:hypothetical protein